LVAPPETTFPLPDARPEFVRRVVDLVRRDHGVELPFDDAKSLLERVAHFIYLTEVYDRLEPLRKQGSGSEESVSGGNPAS